MRARRQSVDREVLATTLRPENSSGFLLWQVANQWQRMQRSALGEIGITHVQFILLAGLAWLEQRESSVSQARLAEFCKTDPMMTSQVVRTLERAKLLVREDHPTDRRAKRLTITSEGVAALNKAMPKVMDIDTSFFQEVGARKKDLIEQLQQIWHVHAEESI